MIPVTLQPEPADFDVNVRQKGHAWLAHRGIALDAAPPRASKLPHYWTRTNKQLWKAYSGVCAYLAIFFEWSTGATTDHFIAKSRKAGDAYEWNNYRLSCSGPNQKKNRFDDVLDPIGLAPHTFVINFASGKILPNPDLPKPQKNAARKTIRRLDLASPENNAMRARHYGLYANGDLSLQYLCEHSPFVYAEIVRQEL
jgi:uncharacterized protein (TIGR02646 family)